MMSVAHSDWNIEGMARYLKRVGCLLKDFGSHVETMTGQLIEQSLQRAGQYIEFPSLRKEDYAHSIAEVDGVTEGLATVLTCVEPCRSFEIFRNKNTKNLNSLHET